MKNNTDVMQKFESLSKEELIKKLNLAMDAALAIDGMWFLNVEELLGFEKTNGVNLKVWDATEEELDALIVANVVMELQEFGGCSSLLVEPPRSATGVTLFGRNADYPPRGVLDRYGLMTIFRPKGKHAFASIGLPGLGGVMSGMNDAGLALATHSAGGSRDNGPALNPLGTPLYTTFRQILEELYKGGRLVDQRRIDHRNPLFGVASLAYSRAVNGIAATWMAVWRESGGERQASSRGPKLLRRARYPAGCGRRLRRGGEPSRPPIWPCGGRVPGARRLRSVGGHGRL